MDKLIRLQTNLQIIVMITNIAANFVTREAGMDGNVEGIIYLIVGIITVFQIIFSLWLRFKMNKMNKMTEYTVKNNAPTLSYMYVVINFAFVVTLYARWTFI